MWGVLFQPGAWWLGCHYSEREKRYCLNLVPCFTIWILAKDGKAPSRKSLFVYR